MDKQADTEPFGLDGVAETADGLVLWEAKAHRSLSAHAACAQASIAPEGLGYRGR